MNFLQFFVWGAWLITIGTYCINTQNWGFEEFGAIFSTLALSSIFMPPLVGIIADKWINAEKLYGILQIGYGIVLFFVPQVSDPETLYYVIFLAMIFYMPTISLCYSLSYSVLKKYDYDVVKAFPNVRVWGTIGFIIALWVVDFTGSNINANQFYIGSVGAVLLGLYAFTLPKTPPQKSISENASWLEQLGLDAFKLFGNYKMAMFFIFSLLLGAALQLTNMYGDAFLNSFESIAAYKDSFAVQNSTFVMSLSQISETLFILAIPFFLKKFGIKKVMLMSMLAWVVRFGFFSFGSPDGFGLILILISNIVYGMAFDFFNISGSLFVETSTDSKMRGSAQGLFMMMTNGVGAYLGSKVSGMVINKYFVKDGVSDWHGIWLTFAIYALVVAILFAILFKHKEQAGDLENVKH